MKFLFLDTNVYMHYHRVDEIDWTELFEVDQVKIVVPKITITELDKHKNGHRTRKMRERCRVILEKFESWFEKDDEEIRSNISIQHFGSIPKIDFEEKGLNESSSDDILIATILQFQIINPSAEITLVTQDTGPRLTAKQLGIKVKRLSDNFKLPEEIDEQEKQIKELTREVQKLKNLRPNLKLAFIETNNASDHTTLNIYPPLSVNEAEVKHKYSEIKIRYPKMSYVGRHPLHRDYIFFGPTDEQVNSYNRDLEKFYNDCQRFFHQVVAYQNFQRRTVKIDINALNSGNAPGDDLHIWLHFPNGFALYEEASFPKAPEKPEPPVEPTGHPSDILRNLNIKEPFTGNSLADIIQNTSGLKNITDLKIKKASGYEVTLKVKRVQHGVPIHLPTLFAGFDKFEEAASFGIDYKIQAANHPDAFEGRLNVIIKKDDG
jgi:rRNA-processing protein FCF1